MKTDNPQGRFIKGESKMDQKSEEILTCPKCDWRGTRDQTEKVGVPFIDEMSSIETYFKCPSCKTNLDIEYR